MAASNTIRVLYCTYGCSDANTRGVPRSPAHAKFPHPPSFGRLRRPPPPPRRRVAAVFLYEALTATAAGLGVDLQWVSAERCKVWLAASHRMQRVRPGGVRGGRAGRRPAVWHCGNAPLCLRRFRRCRHSLGAWRPLETAAVRYMLRSMHTAYCMPPPLPSNVTIRAPFWSRRHLTGRFVHLVPGSCGDFAGPGPNN